MSNLYFLAKVLHIFAFTAWMAAMFYLPRLFVYSTSTSDLPTMLVMQKRLYKLILMPAMIATFAAGIWLVSITTPFAEKWFHIKALLVLMLAGLSGFMGAEIKRIEKGQIRAARYYKWLNELPTVIFLLIVILVVYKI
jgi:protoporphyrinogen IX oxidase